MIKKLMMAITVAGALCAVSAIAQVKEDPSTYDKIWNCAKLIDNKDAAVIQSLALTGRLQGDAAYFSSDDNGDFSDLVWRRFRFGGKAKLFQDFVIHAEADFDLNNAGLNETFYTRLTDAYIGWAPSKKFELKVGKQSAGFTLDGATSSKNLITLERSVLAENLWFTTEYFTGVSASGKVEGWEYNLGGFSSSGAEEFGKLDSGWFGLASLGHAVTKNTKARVDYVHNDPDYTGDVGTKKLSDVGSFVTQSEFGRLGFMTDLSFAKGIDSQNQSDLVGLQLMPYWNFNDRWQAVFRYSMVHSTDGPGAKMSRYSKEISDSAYEDVQEFYLGLNCYLYGHKLKWQNGIEYNIAQNDKAGNDYAGWGVTSGIRLSW